MIILPRMEWQVMNKFSIILTSILTRSDGGVNYTPETESPGEDDEISVKPETKDLSSILILILRW